MGGISPIQLFIIPFVFLFALPLAIFAGITTILAFLVLYLRLTIAYFDIGLDTIRFLVLGNGARHRQLESSGAATPITPLSPLGASRPSSPEYRQPRHRRKGRGSVSSGSLTPVAPAAVGGISSGVPLTPAVGFDRDFEGIGGWRIENSLDVGSADDNDEKQWYSLNSRLELPDHHHYHHHQRPHHFRSRSGGAVLSGMKNGAVGSYITAASTGARTGSVSPGALKMTASPNSSRSRTPTSTRPYAGLSKFDNDEYFPALERKHVKKLSA